MTIEEKKIISSDRLEFLYRITQAFNASLDLDEVLNIVIDEIIELTGAERGFLMLYDSENNLAFQVARGIDQTNIENPEHGISHSVINKVAESGEGMFTLDAQTEDSLSAQLSIVNFKLRAILCTPLMVKDKILGVVYVDNRMVPGVFTEDDLDMLKTVASNAAVAIENARLYLLAVDKGKIEKELQVAKKVQSGLIPQSTPEIEGWEFATYWEPAKEVAGDFFDFIEKKNGKIGLIIADVVDKGIAAALYMAFSRSTLRASLSGSQFPGTGISEANQLICNDTAYGMFLTLAYLEIEPGSFEINIVNAGHNPPLVYQKSVKGLTPVVRTGMLVGVDDQAEYEESKVKLEVGDFIVFFTDGVTEAINQKDEEFGNKRLEKIILSNKKSSAHELMDIILDNLNSFTKDTPQFDDITLLIAKRI